MNNLIRQYFKNSLYLLNALNIIQFIIEMG